MAQPLIINKNGSAFLNLLRVFAAQAVVIGHLISWLKIFPMLEPPYMPYMQGIGVVIFFILSGFVIPYSTVQKFNADNNYSFKEFFIERFVRIYSAYLPCLLFIFVIDFVIILIDSNSYTYYETFNLKTFIGNLFMLQEHPMLNIFGLTNIESFGSDRPLWTLAIEWWIYFWFGFLYIVLIKRKLVNPLTVLVFIILSLVPFYNFNRGLGDGLMLPWLLGTGILIALPVINKLEINKFLILLFTCFLTVFMFKRFRAVHFDYNDTIYALYLSVLILLLISFFNRIKFSEKVIKLINLFADFSFSLYLLHYTIISLMLILLKNKINPYLFFILAFVISNIISFYFASITEMKYKKLRNYLKRKLLTNTA